MKGQGALEYLMTYGWALLVVVVVGAALYSLGVLNPGTYAKQACTGFVYFNAREFRMTSDANFTIIVDNGPNRVWFSNITVRLPGQTWAGISGGPATSKIVGANCTSATDTACTGNSNIGPNERHSLSMLTGPGISSTLQGNSGAPYTVDIRITYFTVDMQHQDIATCTGKYESV